MVQCIIFSEYYSVKTLLLHVLRLKIKNYMDLTISESDHYPDKSNDLDPTFMEVMTIYPSHLNIISATGSSPETNRL